MFKKLSLFINLVFFYLALQAQQNCNCAGITDFNRNLLNADSLINADEAGCVVQGYRIKARSLLLRRELDSAETFINRATAILDKNKCSEDDYLIFYQMLDNLFANRSDFKGAIEMELKIVSFFEKKRDTINYCRGLLNISNIFNEIKQTDKGIEYCRKAITLINKLNNSSEKAVLFARSAQRFYAYYKQNNQKEYLDSTAYYAQRGNEILKSIPFEKEAFVTVNSRLAAVAIEKKEFDKALLHIELNLLKLNRQIDLPEVSASFNDKAKIYFATKQYSFALQFADSTLFYNKLLKSPSTIAETYKLIYAIAEASGNSVLALSAYKQGRAITDSIDTEKKTAAVAELEKKYNQAKNEKTIKELAQQKQIYILLAAAGLLGLLALAFFVRQITLKHKQRILETEQRLNRARMNPHFFFNALASLQSFAIRENDGEAIASSLSKFSHIMRETLESTYKEYVTVEQEIDFLNEYLDVQKIRFPKKFEYTITTDKNLEIDELQIPAMIIQPFAENSIEHGFSNIDYTGQLNIHFTQKNNDLQIEIVDNGKGLQTGLKIQNEHISRASQIIKDRMYLLNIKLKSKASFSISNNENDNGVVIKINLPLIYIQTA
jgi:anti-sigma regulatory factor (Ser/Thr protein kinase)